jgi:hypothetical protein
MVLACFLVDFVAMVEGSIDVVMGGDAVIVDVDIEEEGEVDGEEEKEREVDSVGVAVVGPQGSYYQIL